LEVSALGQGEILHAFFVYADIQTHLEALYFLAVAPFPIKKRGRMFFFGARVKKFRSEQPILVNEPSFPYAPRFMPPIPPAHAFQFTQVKSCIYCSSLKHGW
jgi:hypothetical protein